MNRGSYLFILLIFFGFTLLGAQGKVEQIETSLLFYPENGEKELLLYIDKNKQSNELDKYKISYLRGMLAYKKSNVDSAIMHLKSSLLYFIKNNNQLYVDKTQLLLGNISEKIGNFDMAFFYYNDITKKLNNGDKRVLGSAYLGIARCKMFQYGAKKGDNPELKNGIKLLKSIGKKEFDLYADYMACILSSTDNCKQQLKKIAQAYENMGSKNYASSAFKSLALMHLNENQYDSARHYAKHAIPLTQNTYPSFSLAPALYHIIGITDVKRKDYVAAERNYRYSLRLCDSLMQKGKKYYTYKSLAALDSIRGDLASSQRHLTLAYKAKNFSSDTKVGYKFIVEDLIVKVDRLKLSLEKKAFYTNSFILATLTVLMVSGIVFLLVRKKNIMDKEKLETEKKAIEYILIHLKKTTDFDLNDEHIEEIINNVAEPIPPVSESFETGYSGLIEDFKLIFEQLSEGEVRYAVMIYIGLSNEVIANVKDVEVESVRKAKRRIREKLLLKTGADLQKHFKQVLGIKNNFKKFS